MLQKVQITIAEVDSDSRHLPTDLQSSSVYAQVLCKCVFCTSNCSCMNVQLYIYVHMRILYVLQFHLQSKRIECSGIAQQHRATRIRPDIFSVAYDGPAALTTSGIEPGTISTPSTVSTTT